MMQFDIVGVMLHIISDSQQLSYLGLACLGLLASNAFFRNKIEEKNNETSTLETMVKAVRRIDKNSFEFKYLLRAF
jgi:hypothetical protein